LAGEFGSGTAYDKELYMWWSAWDWFYRWNREDGGEIVGAEDCFPTVEDSMMIFYIPYITGTSQEDCELNVLPETLGNGGGLGYCMYLIGVSPNPDIWNDDGNLDSLVDEGILVDKSGDGSYDCGKGKVYRASNPYVYGWAWDYVAMWNGHGDYYYDGVNTGFTKTLNDKHDGVMNEYRDTRNDEFPNGWR